MFHQNPARLASIGVALANMLLAGWPAAFAATLQAVNTDRPAAHNTAFHLIRAFLAERALAFHTLRRKAVRVGEVTVFAQEKRMSWPFADIADQPLDNMQKWVPGGAALHCNPPLADLDH